MPIFSAMVRSGEMTHLQSLVTLHAVLAEGIAGENIARVPQLRQIFNRSQSQ
jgi:hypothetical protein